MKELSQLVEAAQSGNREAYDVLIQRFQQMAYAIANRYLRDHFLAQDVVQEAALEAFVHLQELREPAAFPGWFRQIVFRQCTRVLRQARIPCLSLEAVGDDLLTEDTPEEIAVQGEVRASVREGNTVRRPAKGNAAFVHDLLLQLCRCEPLVQPGGERASATHPADVCGLWVERSYCPRQ